MEEETEDTSNLDIILFSIAAAYLGLLTLIACLYCGKKLDGKEAIKWVLGPLLAPLILAGTSALLACALALLIPACMFNFLVWLMVLNSDAVPRPPRPYPRANVTEMPSTIQGFLIVRELLSLGSNPPMCQGDAMKQFPKFPRHYQGPITALGGSSTIVCFSEPIIGTATTTESGSAREINHESAGIQDDNSEQAKPRCRSNLGNVDSSHNTESSHGESGSDLETSVQSETPSPTMTSALVDGAQNDVKAEEDNANNGSEEDPGMHSNRLWETTQSPPRPPAVESKDDVEAVVSLETSCGICSENFERGDFVAWSKKNLDCPHVYHHHCLTNWLEQEEQNHCPICRQEYF